MFREMRRIKQLLSHEEAEAVLNRNTAGILAVSGDDDYPYAVPLSYVYCDGKIIFHSAKKGHKLDGIANNEKVSFCVVDKDEIVPEKFTTYFRSVICFGRARILEDREEIIEAANALALKYAPDSSMESRMNEINSEFKAMTVVVIDIEHMTAKEAIELVNMKK